MEIQKSLERIELQLKAIWWDNLAYCVLTIILFAVVLAILFDNLSIIIYFVIFIIAFLFIQIFEHIEKNNIREVYKNGSNEKRICS